MKLDRLREWRDYRGLTQEELAERAGVARYSISNYESGKTSARRATAQRLAAALDLQVADLMTPPAPPKGPAPLRLLPEEQRRALLELVAAKRLPPLPGELQKLMEIKRAAVAAGMSSDMFDVWFKTYAVEDVRDELLPEEGATLEEVFSSSR